MNVTEWLKNRSNDELVTLERLLLFGGPHSVKSRQYQRHHQVWLELAERQKRQLDFMDGIDKP